MTRIGRERRHTLHFLHEVRRIAAVFVDTEVDMTSVQRHRAAGRYSFVTYVLHSTARVLARHPQANAAIRGRVMPRIARYPSVDGKLALDKRINGQRIVLAAVLPGLHEAGMDEIQQQVDHYRTGDPERMPEFAGARTLHRLPWPLGPVLFRLAVRPLRTRARRLGTFAVTSLGHRAVDGFYSVGGTTITIGMGRVVDRPVVRAGQVVVAPVMRLSLTFDHRVIDGAEAADILTETKESLESFDRAPVIVR